MRFQLNDIVKMSRTTPEYADETFELIKDEEGRIDDIEDIDSEPILVRFFADNENTYSFYEHEIRLVRREQ